MSALIYTLALCALCVFYMRFANLQHKFIVFIFCAIVGNLPILFGFSLVEWIDSVLGNPSLFLLLLSLCVCFVAFCAPREIVLSLGAKIFIAILGLAVFLGNLNLLWGFDLFSLPYQSQFFSVLGILFFALWIDLFFGILYLICLIVCFALSQNNLLAELIDVSVWLYALVGLATEYRRGIERG